MRNFFTVEFLVVEVIQERLLILQHIWLYIMISSHKQI